MNIIKRITVPQIIELIQDKIPPTLKIDEERIVENIYIALKKIGIKQNELYTSVLELKDYKSKLPEWIDSIEKVLYINRKQSITEIQDKINYYINIAEPLQLTDTFEYDREVYGNKYHIRDGYIHSNLKEGYFIIIMTKVPINEEGELYIEDEINLIEALVWYNVKELLWKATVRNPTMYSALLGEANKEWGYYSVNAKTATIFPKNEDELRYLRNKYTRFMPDLKQ